MNILHIITGLGDGGAEHTLYKICKYDTKNKHIVSRQQKFGHEIFSKRNKFKNWIEYKSNVTYTYVLKN